MSHYIEASTENLLEDAAFIATRLLQQGKHEVDAVFGDGFSAQHPELVTAYMRVASNDLGVTTFSKVLGAGLQEIAQAIEK